MNHPLRRLSALLFAALLPAAAAPPPSLMPLMPHAGDFTSMGWAEGFPGVAPGAPWLRWIQTGHYAMVLDTETMRITRLGPVAAGADYTSFGRSGPLAANGAGPVDLDLSISANGRTYRCSGGGKWSRFTGPRLIEAGRFLQRADVTNLVFTTADGATLNTEARFETVAWPDRLALILAAKPAPGEAWNDAAMEIKLSAADGTRELHQRWSLPQGQAWSQADWHEVAVVLEPATFRAVEPSTAVSARAAEIPGGKPRQVVFDPIIGWHKINLDAIEPLPPPAVTGPSNDAIERVSLVLSNPSATEQIARLMFEKTAHGIRQPIGSAITGISAVLRDSAGNPTGIPVQLSKNWHDHPQAGVYSGAWFHGISQLRLPPASTTELEITLCYGHWGGVAAASHAQLCLIGWGSNQHWSESALGAWGESICYEPEQVQANCSITDVRPVMVGAMKTGDRWGWTSNVGGGDFFRFFDPAQKRVPHAAMRTTYLRQGPCLTEVAFAGRIGTGITHSCSVSLARTDDIVRAVYQLRMDVTRPTDFSRLVIFQIGADTYSYTGERKMAIGDESGLLKEWDTRWGGNTYRTQALACGGRIPWASLHQAVPREDVKPGAWANRGIVIRGWKARLGGRDAPPWLAERGITIHGSPSSTLDFLPPPGLTRLEPGDFVEATLELIVMPQFAADYYGPNEPLRAALSKNPDSWQLIHREATGNQRRVEVSKGTLLQSHPDIRILADGDRAAFTLAGGLGYVPVTFTGLTSNRGYTLELDGSALNQSIHGNDFWQTDYDPVSQRWSRTYNIPVGGEHPHSIAFRAEP